jgi:hypothetical protein
MVDGQIDSIQQSESSRHDPNYKWRVIAGLCTILLSLLTAFFIITQSAAQSQESSVFIFGMAASIVIVVVMTLFRYPNEIRPVNQPHTITNSPAFIIFIAIAAELIASTVTVFVLRLLEP